MTERQEQFVRAYRQGGDAAQACMEAYPHVKRSEAARRVGEKLLEKLEIAREARGQNPVADEREIMEFYSAVMRGQAPDEGGVKLSERISAADKLVRMIASDGRGEPGALQEIMEAVGAIE